MRICGAILLGMLSYLLWPERPVRDIPFAQLTLGILGQAAVAACLSLMAIAACFSSLEHEKIWPWYWTRRGLHRAGRVIASVILVGFIFAAYENDRFSSFLKDHVLALLIVITSGMMLIRAPKEDRHLDMQDQSKDFDRD